LKDVPARDKPCLCTAARFPHEKIREGKVPIKPKTFSAEALFERLGTLSYWDIDSFISN